MVDRREIGTDLEINKGLLSPLFIKYVGGEENLHFYISSDINQVLENPETIILIDFN